MSTPCVLCLGETTSLAYKYRLCELCGFVFVEPEFRLSVSEEKARYEMHENSADNVGYVKMLEKFIDTAVLPFKGKGKALDFGSGPGPVLAGLLRKNGFEVGVYDPYFAPNKSVLNEKYDLITCTETCEHFRNPLKEFTWLADLLKKGGVLCIQTQFKPKNADFMDWYYIKDPTHIGFYDKRVFEKIVEPTGLKILYCDNVKYCVLVKL